MATTLPPSSTLTANEKLVDLYMERAVDLLRLEAGTRDKVLVFLSELENEIVGQIAKINPTGDPSIIRQRNRLAKLLDEVRSTIKGTYRDVSTLMAREIRDIADNEATWTGHAINAATSATFADVGLTSAFLSSIVENSSFLGGASKDWWSRQAGGLFDKFADEMRRGVALGESNAKLIDRVRGTTGQPGIMDISRNSAERLVRASVQSAANTAREAMYERNDDLIVSLQWHATLDTRTSEWCITRDGHHYSNTEDHKPKDGGPAWLEGPGKLHWGALTKGTLVETKRGQVAIETIQFGDVVLTHDGKWSTVTATRAKRLEQRAIRSVHTESGRILRATDDHPVRLSDGRWVFVGALELGDNLLCNPESLCEVIFANSVIDSESQYGPAVSDDSHISFKRALQLVAPDVDFESAFDRGYSEIENRCARVILRDPSIIERDQSVEHHLFAVAHGLQKMGRNRLGDFLTMIVRDDAAFQGLTNFEIGPVSKFRFGNLFHHLSLLGRILVAHAFRLIRILGVGVFSRTPRPMFFARGSNDASTLMIEPCLIGDGSNGDRMSSCECGKTPVSEGICAFDAAKGCAALDVLANDKISVIGSVFHHDPIVALEVQTYNGFVYDLEVAGQSSYVANGIVVSNCRSTSIPILKSWRDLGIDADEIPQTTRASMDGQVPAQMSFEAWLKKQSVERQDTVLGEGKAQLWRDGKITFRDLLDQGGRPLTTEQVRAKAARK